MLANMPISDIVDNCVRRVAERIVPPILQENGGSVGAGRETQRDVLNDVNDA